MLRLEQPVQLLPTMHTGTFVPSKPRYRIGSGFRLERLMVVDGDRRVLHHLTMDNRKKDATLR
jgi:hypothetical protein